MMKNKSGGKIMTQIVTLRAKMYAYRKFDISCDTDMSKKGKTCIIKEDKKRKETEKCVETESLSLVY